MLPAVEWLNPAMLDRAQTLLPAIAAADLWQQAVAGAASSPVQRARGRRAGVHAVAGSMHAVELLVTAAGVTAIYTRSPLERRFRGLRTAATHPQAAQRVWEVEGRVTLGLEPGMAYF
ncbi:MAG TPA: hypothetical protein VH916_10325 [Dehalococcoidia bacterium]